jgi:hypothetical protein
MGSGRANAVPFALPARFLLSGTAALAASTSALALAPQLLLGHHGAPSLLAIVHGITLGFATLVYVGAMHQLVPVLLDAPLRSVVLGHVVFASLVAGVAGVVVGFAGGFTLVPLAVGGSLIVAGLGLFLGNVIATALAARGIGAVGHALIASSAYLMLTAVLGTLLVIGRVVPSVTEVLGYATPLHLGLGLFGAFFLAIVGAGHRLLAMFVLSHGVGATRVGLATGLVHAALAVLFVTTLARLPGAPLAALLLAAAVLAYLDDVRRILKVRVRRHLEPPIQAFLTGAAFLPLAALLALSGRIPTAVTALLAGFVTLTIAGMLVKIVGFMAWQHRYAAQVGRAPVPMVRDMTRPTLERLTLWALAAGALGLVACSIWPSLALASGAAVVFALGAWALALHVAVIVFAPHEAQNREEEPHAGLRHARA